MKSTYEINSSTIAILPIDENNSKIIELDNELVIEKSTIDIINDSCKYFGSSYQGRYEGSKNFLGMSYKLPIIIEETRNLIFFPTQSPRHENCAWISLNHLNDYNKDNKSAFVNFKNGYILKLDISGFTLENQVLRASRLESVLRTRKI